MSKKKHKKKWREDITTNTTTTTTTTTNEDYLQQLLSPETIHKTVPTVSDLGIIQSPQQQHQQKQQQPTNHQQQQQKQQGKKEGSNEGKEGVVALKHVQRVRKVFDSPFTIKWDAVSQEKKEEFMVLLQQLLSGVVKPKITKSRGNYQGKHKKDQLGPVTKRQKVEKDAGDNEESKTEKQPKSPSLLDRFGVGINSATRSVEKDEAYLVVVAKDVTPPILINHFPVLCRVQEVTLLALADASAELGKLFGCRSVAAFAVKKPTNNTFPEVDEFVLKVRKIKPTKVQIPWLTSQIARQYFPVNVKQVGPKRPPSNKKNTKKKKKIAKK